MPSLLSGGGLCAAAVVGPTASGKTAFAILLAQALNAEIVGCDSMQIYRYMDIGTAKPTAEERAAVPHHMIDFKNPDEEYSAAGYAADALPVCREIAGRGKLPLFCGGTGLYLDAARTGRYRPGLASDAGVRQALCEEAQRRGGEEMYAELASVDPESAAATHPNNLRRVLRALEIFRVSGRPKSEWDRESLALPPAMDLLTICLLPRDRAALHHRIDRRVSEMAEAGLRRETEQLLMRGYLRDGKTAAQAIGYKEYVRAIDGEITEEEALDEIRYATHRYARRQLTWFRAGRDTLFLPIGEEGATPEDAKTALDAIRAHLEK